MIELLLQAERALSVGPGRPGRAAVPAGRRGGSPELDRGRGAGAGRARAVRRCGGLPPGASGAGHRSRERGGATAGRPPGGGLRRPRRGAPRGRRGRARARPAASRRSRPPHRPPPVWWTACSGGAAREGPGHRRGRLRRRRVGRRDPRGRPRGPRPRRPHDRAPRDRQRRRRTSWSGSYADPAVVGPLLGPSVPTPSSTARRARWSPRASATRARYYRDNVAGGVTLLEAARSAGIGAVVFSSTAAVYGVPRRDADRGGRPVAPDQPVRRDEANARGGAALVRGGVRAAERQPPLLQRRGRDRPDRRGPPPRVAPRPQRADRGRGRPGADRVRRGLSDARWHADPRLHPRLGPRRRPSRRARPGRGRRAGGAAASRRRSPATSGRPPASRCARSCAPRRRSSAGRSRTPWARGERAIPPSSWPRTSSPARSWAGRRDGRRSRR